MNFAQFRRNHPGFITAVLLTLVALVALDTYVIRKRQAYQAEIARLRSGMSRLERQRTDAILASDAKHFQVMVALARRQAEGDRELHLAVAVDSGAMLLEQEGALLREMPVQVGPERVVGTAPDTVRMAVPRGARTVERVLDGSAVWEVPRWVYQDRGTPVPADRSVKGALGPAAVVLAGGTVVYSLPTTGPLADSAYVMPGSIRARTADLLAVLPNLKPGMTIYFY